MADSSDYDSLDDDFNVDPDEFERQLVGDEGDGSTDDEQFTASDADDSDETEDDDEQSSTLSLILSLGQTYGLPVLSAFLIGLVIHLLMRPPKVIVRQIRAASRDRELSVEELEGRAETRMEIGEFDSAIALYAQIQKKVPQLSRENWFKMAVCQEGMGQWEDAIDSYRKAVEGIDSLTKASEVCQARTWLRRRNLREARQLLWGILRESNRAETSGQPFLADAIYLAGMSLSSEGTSAEVSPALEEASVIHAPTDWPPERSLEWLTSATQGNLPAKPHAPRTDEAATPDPDTANVAPDARPPESDTAPENADPPIPENVPSAPEINLLPAPADREFAGPRAVAFLQPADSHEPTTKPAEMRWDAPRMEVFGILDEGTEAYVTRPSQSLASLLDEVAAARQYTVEWSEKGRYRARGKRASLYTAGIPYFVLLTSLTEPYGLVWEIEGATLRLTDMAELDRDELLSWRHRMGRIVLKYALSKAPGHPYATSAQLEVANLAYKLGSLDEAAEVYEKVRGLSSSSVSISATYNLSLIQRHRGQYDDARESLYRVVDGLPGHPLTPMVYLTIGRMFLDEGNAADSRPPLRRALKSETDHGFQAVTAIHLAMAHLMLDQFEEAGALMLEHRPAFQSRRHRGAAAMLVSYARMKAMRRGTQLDRETAYMYRSLMSISEDRNWLGVTGLLLAGRSYIMLGMRKEASEVYRHAMGLDPSGEYATEMQYGIADYAFTSGKRDQALTSFSELASVGGRWSGLAHYRIALSEYEDGFTDDCIATCAKLLKRPDFIQVEQALRLMGQAYEKKGDLESASLCYAGQVERLFASQTPDPATDSNTNQTSEPPSAPQPQAESPQSPLEKPAAGSGTRIAI